ncbi:hypothetical protein QAD02_010071 [Eretmocerus hayati]|uniref:Uncharacterized protein n=1 Tax=Eretmocerus hayati TaxID=131215 RepID=A0ACC2NBA6_9HYME|nr:hypothetical protein QAD02_010071 [Eretmocerus hayati]
MALLMDLGQALDSSFIQTNQEENDYKPIAGAIRELSLHHVTLFLPTQENSKSTKKMNEAVKCLITQESAYCIEYQLRNVEDVDQKSFRNILENSRSSTIIVSLTSISQSDGDPILNLNDTFNDSLEIIANSSNRNQPRFLSVIMTDEIIPQQLIKEMLIYAWSKKFLDVTVLEWSAQHHSCDFQIVSHMYNPFLNQYHQDCYTPTMDLFPDKLRDMHGYPFKVGIVHRPPNMNFIINSSGQVVQINGTDYGYLLILSEYFNFAPQLTAADATTYLEKCMENNTKSMFEMVVDGTLDYSGTRSFLYLDDIKYPTNNILSETIAIAFDDLVALVPILPRKSTHVFSNGAILCIGTLLYLALISAIVKILKFDTSLWMPDYIIRILFGDSVPRVPTRTAERIVFFVLFFASQQLAMQLFTEFADNQIDNENLGQYENLYDLKGSNIRLVIFSRHVNIVFHENNSALDHLRDNIELTKAMDCPDRIMRNEHVICLIDRSVAENIIIKSRRMNGRRMKIMNHNFWSTARGYYFSPKSPYVEQFNKVLQRILETGLWMRYTVINRYQFERSDEFIKYTVDHEIFGKLLLIWLLGCGISTIAFLLELVYHRWISL